MPTLVDLRTRLSFLTNTIGKKNPQPEEELVADVRANMSPSQMVELKLKNLRKHKKDEEIEE